MHISDDLGTVYQSDARGVVYRTLLSIVLPSQEGSDDATTLFDALTTTPIDLPAVGQRFLLEEWEPVLNSKERFRLTAELSENEIDRLAVGEVRRKRFYIDENEIVIVAVAVLRVDESLEPSIERQLEEVEGDLASERDRFDALVRLFANTVRNLGREAHSLCETRIVEALRLERFGVDDGEYRPRDGLEQLATMRLLGYEPWDRVVPTVRHVVEQLDETQRLAQWFIWAEPVPDDVRDTIGRYIKSGELPVSLRDLSEAVNDLVGYANRAVSETADLLKERLESGACPED